MKPLISVIIPCYNTAQYLPQCMLSLEMQTLGFEKIYSAFLLMMHQLIMEVHGNVLNNLKENIHRK